MYWLKIFQLKTLFIFAFHRVESYVTIKNTKRREINTNDQSTLGILGRSGDNGLDTVIASLRPTRKKIIS